jgi:hypothetical protein
VTVIPNESSTVTLTIAALFANSIAAISRAACSVLGFIVSAFLALPLQRVVDEVTLSQAARVV